MNLHRILIVDDERPARDYIAELVTSYIPNSIVTHADSAQNAFNRLRAEDFDLMFVDIDFGAGKMTGLELLEEIKRMGKQMYVMIISAHYNFEYVIRGMELGAARYIPKPSGDNSENTVQYIDKPLYKDRVYDAIKLYLSATQTDVLNLKTPDGFYKIQISRMLAIEAVDRKKVRIYTVDTIFPEVFISLSQIHKRLPSNFRYIWRNSIVNVQEVRHYNIRLKKIFIVCQNKEYSFIASRDNMKKLVAVLNPENSEDDEK